MIWSFLLQDSLQDLVSALFSVVHNPADMKKENSVVSKAGEFPGRLTRARAAACCASRQLPPLKEPAQGSQNQPLCANPKRAASDGTYLRRKKRAVLQDVTNVYCENSYRSCFNSTVVQVFIHILAPTVFTGGLIMSFMGS